MSKGEGAYSHDSHCARFPRSLHEGVKIVKDETDGHRHQLTSTLRLPLNLILDLRVINTTALGDFEIDKSTNRRIDESERTSDARAQLTLPGPRVRRRTGDGHFKSGGVRRFLARLDISPWRATVTRERGRHTAACTSGARQSAVLRSGSPQSLDFVAREGIVRSSWLERTKPGMASVRVLFLGVVLALLAMSASSGDLAVAEAPQIRVLLCTA
eukprot:scaffold3277_cov218-Pinguiococcus_pyrenoidosus.AAC.9